MKQLAKQVSVKEGFSLTLGLKLCRETSRWWGGLSRFYWGGGGGVKRLCTAEFMWITLWGLAFGNEGWFYCWGLKCKLPFEEASGVFHYYGKDKQSSPSHCIKWPELQQRPSKCHMKWCFRRALCLFFGLCWLQQYWGASKIKVVIKA